MPSRAEFLAVTITAAFLIFGVWAVREFKHSYLPTADRVVISQGSVYWVNDRTGIACKQLPEEIEGKMIVWGRKSLCSLAIHDVLVLRGDE